jgi:ribosomal protein S18 acetylase RimI-like enzyme
MDLNSTHLSCSEVERAPAISGGNVRKIKAKYLEDYPDIKPYKLSQLSELQKSSIDDFSCGNSLIDEFLSNGGKLRFQVERHKMDSMIMATETKVLGYMAHSFKEVTFSIPNMCSQALKEYSGLKQGDKIFVIHYLAVDEACKGKGLGESLVLKALTACMQKAKTDPNLKLIVLHATPTACGFYEKLGFFRVGEVDEGLIEYAYTVTE